ncbi:MAG: aminotransferase class-III, partial [Actinotalea sp.]|nr:aminotransferase class-III [Actinotalea sp.]
MTTSTQGPFGAAAVTTSRTPAGTDRAQAARDHLWGHFTRHSTWEQGPVPVMVRGEGHHVWDADGRRYIDGLSGLFVVQVGHGRVELAERARQQASELAF